MNQLLFERSTGSIGPRAFARLHSDQLLHAIQHAPTIRFNGGEAPVVVGAPADEAAEEAKKLWAHSSGVNAIVVDPFEGRLLVSGGADSNIRIWNLEQLRPSGSLQTLKPVGEVSKTTPLAHRFGITSLSFYPFDSAAFLSSSYDHTIKLYSTESLQVSATFDLESIIYSHAMSPVAPHLLVACATQHPAVRLVDLKSGSSAHSLAGHHGAVVSVAWSPVNENIVASGGTDGTVRIWDVRKSAATLGLLDMEDSVGLLRDGSRPNGRARETAKAHDAAVNGLSWTDDGAYIVTAGHDERIRVWDAATGANTLASFGPILRNNHLSHLPLLMTAVGYTRAGKELLYYPNENEILRFELHEGKLLGRMKVPGPVTAAVRSRNGERNVRNRVTAMSWRTVDDGFYSAHSDGQIRAWLPRTKDDEITDEADRDAESGNADGEGNSRKRRVLDEVFRDLTKQKITFG